MVFLGEEIGKIFLWNFFEHTKEILRPADLNTFPSGQAFMVPNSGSFYIYIGGTLFC